MSFSDIELNKKYAPATQRNREPILEVLQSILSPHANILEIASGTGEHALFFASKCPQWRWIPSDIYPESLLSISAWRQDCPTNNLQPPLKLDMMDKNWYKPLLKSNLDAIICINMIHISPWKACQGLMAGAEQILNTDGILYLYGPYQINQEHTAVSNQEFDQYLQSQNQEWGVRNLEDVSEIALQHNFKLEKTVSMPVNNLSVIFRKQ